MKHHSIGRTNKNFEREINISIVHWIRSYLGLNLPVFFNKYQPGFEAKIPPDKKYIGGLNPNPIDFNSFKKEGKDKKLLPPAMGQTLLIFRTLGEVLNSFMNDQIFSHFIEEWNKIVKSRNKAPHVEIASINDYINLLNSLVNLSQKKPYKSL
ncbi:MAG: hypothetical protein IPM91_19765 [Bacteroidetes bacterium]|nr:hypothetical protein [Bacteroidota bacterium]